MTKARVQTPEDLRFLFALRESLGIPHRGLAPIPRKVVASAMNRSESFYSRMSDTEKKQQECIPDAVDLRRYMAATGNLEPLRVLQAWVEQGSEAQCDGNPFRLLAESEQATSAFNALLSKLISDGDLSKSDAIEMLPLAAGLLQQAQKNLDVLRKRAGRR